MLKSGVMLMAAVVMLSEYQDPAALKPFSSEAGRFTVSMPGEPNQKAETIKTASGEIKVVGFQVEQEDGVYIVSYTDYAEKMVRASSPGKLLDEGVTGMVTGVNGTLLTSKKVTQDTFPAREFSYGLSGPGGEKALGRARFVFVNDRLYQVVVMGKEAMAKSAAADSFFSSFKFKPGHALATKPADAMKGAQVAKSTAGSETFSSEAGRFTVSMPGRPKEDATTVKTAVGEIKVFNFQVEVDEGVYIVGYSDYPEKFVRASSPDKMLDGGVNGMMTSSKGTVLSLKKVTRDGFPGRELSYTMKGPAGEKALGRAHLLLVNSRVYQVVVVGKESMSKSATADSFLASFKFEPGPALTADSAEPGSAAKAEKSTAAFAPFSSDAGRFEVSMPGEPKETKTTVKTAVGDIKVFMFEVDHRDGDYVVGYSDYPEKILRASGPDAALEGGQKGAVNGVKGTLLTSKKIKQDGFPGLEFSYNLTAAGVPGKAVGRSRLILVKNRLYQVVVIAALSKAKSAANDAFFDSFEFDAGPATEQAVAAAPAKKAPPRVSRLRNAAPAPRSRIANMPRGPVQRRPSAKGSQAAVDSAKWVVWNLDDKPGGISIRVPSQTPERREEAGILGADKRDVFTWADGDVEFTFRSQTIPEAALADGPESVLDAARDAFVKEISGGSLHSERKESVRDKPVREYQIHALALRPNLIRVRSVVVGSQLYEQYVTAPRADVSGPAAGRFFGSLRLPR